MLQAEQATARDRRPAARRHHDRRHYCYGLAGGERVVRGWEALGQGSLLEDGGFLAVYPCCLGLLVARYWTFRGCHVRKDWPGTAGSALED